MDIQQRIAEILRDHWQDSGDSPWVRQYECGCGQKVDDRTPETDHSTHVAEVLVPELGLTQEWGAVVEGETEPDAWMDDLEWAQEQVAERCQSCDHCRNSIPKTLATRYVTEWVPE
jgi:hypothetical protein